MEVLNRTSATHSLTPTSPAAGEFKVADKKRENEAQNFMTVRENNAPEISKSQNEGDKTIDCPGDVLEATGDQLEYGTNLYYESGNFPTLSTSTPQQRRKQAVLRLAQSKAYAELIEERLVLLEKSVAELQPEGRKTLAENNEEDEVAPQSHVSISVLSWVEFRVTLTAAPTIRAHRPEFDLTRKNMIEILRDEPSYSKVSISPDHDPQSPGVNDARGVLPRQAPELNIRPVEFDPHQIRVRSRLLLQILEELTGCNTAVGPWKHKIVFLRPFKLLVYFEDALKDRLKRLEDLHPADGIQRESEHVGGESELNPELIAERQGEEFGPVKETESIEARDQLKCLCDMMETYLQPKILLRGRLNANTTKVGFHDLWYIFRPGCEVRTRDTRQVQVYRVLNVTGGRPCAAAPWRARGRDNDSDPRAVASRKLQDQGYSPGSFLIECFYIHFDGLRYGPVNITFQVRKFDGKKEITSLPIFPLDCDKNEQNTRDELLKRGQEFSSLSNAKAAAHRKYRGLTLDRTQELVESEIIVDFQLAFLRLKGSKPTIGLEDLLLDDPEEYCPPSHDSIQDVSFSTGPKCSEGGCCGNDVTHRDYDVDVKARKAFRDSKPHLLESLDSPEQLTPDHKILLPPCVYGFVLRTRKWATFDIDLISAPEYGNGWNQLVINPETKDSVLALVDNHERPRDSVGSELGVLSSVDLVQGKGKGLIILLHGEPGVGKTSTAECVAAHTHRPLFPITCGDIGHLAEDVEANLEQNFQLAHKWGCVLLLDEADIFLSTRTDDDIQRNAIVSVFLRTLEYYSGILFLTTNRVGKIDSAFKSRIHLSLYYRRLDEESTLQIWENNLKRVKDEFAKENKEIFCEDAEIMKFAGNHYKWLNKDKTLGVWNGRQIRNSFQTAIAIATYEARQKNKNKPQLADGTDRVVIPHLGVAHFKKVAKSARQFDRYLIDLNSGANESQLAKEYTLRYDDFEVSASDRNSSDRKLPKEKRRKRKTSKRRKRNESSSDSSSELSSSSSVSDSSQNKKKKRKRL